MTSNIISRGILKAISIIVGVLLLLLLLYKIQSVLIYIAIAAVTSLIGRPLVRFLKQKLKFKNTFAVVITMVLFLSFIFGLLRMFLPLIKEQGRNLSLLNIDELEQNVEYIYHQIIDYFALKGVDVKQTLQKSNILDKLDFDVIPNFLNTVVSGFGSFSIGLFSVLFITFFLLKDSRLFEQGILVFAPSSKEGRLKKSFETIKSLLSRYFIGLIFQVLILFIIYTIVLLICGISNAIVIAFLCALLNLIPFIGPLISALLMITLTMTSNINQSFSDFILPKTGYVMIGFVIAQLVDNFISQPVIFSKSVKSHPLEIFLIIIISGLLFGIIGMVVAVPGYTAIKVILKEFLYDVKVVKQLTKNL